MSNETTTTRIHWILHLHLHSSFIVIHCLLFIVIDRFYCVVRLFSISVLAQIVPLLINWVMLSSWNIKDDMIMIRIPQLKHIDHFGNINFFGVTNSRFYPPPLGCNICTLFCPLCSPLSNWENLSAHLIENFVNFLKHTLLLILFITKEVRN